jgi:hypothetical protein
MTQGNDHAQVVGQIEAGAKNLALWLLGPKRLYLFAPPTMQQQKRHNEEAKKCNYLIRRKPRASDHFDDAVGQHPTGETSQSKTNCFEFGIRGLHCLKQSVMATLTEGRTAPGILAGLRRIGKTTQSASSSSNSPSSVWLAE